jgi:hypothetical protein
VIFPSRVEHFLALRFRSIALRRRSVAITPIAEVRAARRNPALTAKEFGVLILRIAGFQRPSKERFSKLVRMDRFAIPTGEKS